MLGCVVDHSLQEFNTLVLIRFKTYKIATPHQTKMTSKYDILGIGVFKAPSSMVVDSKKASMQASCKIFANTRLPD